MARTQIAFDDFNRAGTALGSNWTTMNTAVGGDVLIDSSVKFKGQFGLQADSNRASARWSGAGTFSADQYSECRLEGLTGAPYGATTSVGVVCRASGSAGTRTFYSFTMIPATPGAYETSLEKCVNGTRTVLYAGTVAWVLNDLISLEVEGTTIRACRNGTALGGSFTVTDASISTGAPGVIASGATIFGDDWTGGDVTAPAAAPTFTGTIPTLTGVQGAALAAQSPTIASYFTGTGITYTVSPALPSGLSISSSTGVISGTPSADTDWSGAVTATNSGGAQASNTFAITIAATAPTLSSSTKSTPTSTTAVVGCTTDTGNGTMRAVLTLDSAAPSVAQVKAGQNAAGSSATTVIPTALTISSAGAKVFPAASVVSGTTRYGWIVHTNSDGADSAVLSLGVLYPGTGRPVADVSVAGWAPSTGSDVFAVLDEDAESDADFVTSPALSGTATTATMTLDKAYPAGTYSVKVRASVDSGAGTLRVRMLSGADASVGVTADQAITTTPTTYTLPVTVSADAIRIRVEVLSA